MSLKSVILLFAVLFAITSCSHYPSYRYRLTVIVDTPEGPKQGSTIIEVHTGTSSLAFEHVIKRAVGEAAVIDLGKRGLLFAMPRGDSFHGWASVVYSTLTPPPPKGLSLSEAAAYGVRAAQNSKAPIVLPRYFPDDSETPISGYPLLVRFRDPKDYRTLERVDPDNMAATFGEGVKLRKMIVQITQDKPERRVIHYLPWLPDVKGPFDENHMKVRKYGEFQNNLSSGDFDPEIKP